jgi:hypothetical protein
MSAPCDSESELQRPVVYLVRVEGHLDAQWTDWFAGMAITHEAAGETLLRGPLPDQSALHAVLRAVRDLGLPLIAVNRVAFDS